jgi:hypothetical protein
MLEHQLVFVAFIDNHYTLVAKVFDEILSTAMAGLEVEELHVGVTLGKELDSRLLPHDGLVEGR